jgi:hypothetical protein
MNAKEVSETRELAADEIDRVSGGEIWDFGFFRVAGLAYDGGVSLGLEVGGTRYIVNVGSGGINGFTKPA